MTCKELIRSCQKLDKFYTRKKVVSQCLQHIDDIDKYDCVIEPGAGSGAFVKQIKHSNLIAMDISPDHNGIERNNYLTYSLNPVYKNVLIIGNPPFGIKHKMADMFIKHSLLFDNVTTIGFILPNTYNKHTRQKIIPAGEWRIKKIVDLGRDAFLYDNKIYHVPCSFFVFDRSKGKDLRIQPSLYSEAVDFKFGKKDDYDIFMFGASPKRLIEKPMPNNRGYFIKSRIAVDSLIERIRAINWKGNSCANGGVAWFTKTEVVYQYNKAYG